MVWGVGYGAVWVLTVGTAVLGIELEAPKKAKPVRWLIVVMTSVVAVAAAFLAMLAWDTLQRAQTAP